MPSFLEFFWAQENHLTLQLSNNSEEMSKVNFKVYSCFLVKLYKSVMKTFAAVREKTRSREVC